MYLVILWILDFKYIIIIIIIIINHLYNKLNDLLNVNNTSSHLAESKMLYAVLGLELYNDNLYWSCKYKAIRMIYSKYNKLINMFIYVTRKY